jgi:hypothetical protein
MSNNESDYQMRKLQTDLEAEKGLSLFIYI